MNERYETIEHALDRMVIALFFYARGGKALICVWGGGSVHKNKWRDVRKTIMCETELPPTVCNGSPKNCPSTESERLKRSFFGQFYHLWIQVRILKLLQIFGPRVGILVSASLICWFCIFDCAAFCDSFPGRWTVYSPSKDRMFQEKCNCLEKDRDFWKKMRYDGPGCALDETRSSRCLNTRQSPEVAVSGDESPTLRV